MEYFDANAFTLDIPNKPSPNCIVNANFKFKYILIKGASTFPYVTCLLPGRFTAVKAGIYGF